MLAMVCEIISSLGMDQNIEPCVIEHQPWHNLPNQLWREFHLIHRLWMWTDRFLTPAPEFDIKPFGELIPHTRRRLACRGIVVYMDMKSCNRASSVFHEVSPTPPNHTAAYGQCQVDATIPPLYRTDISLRWNCGRIRARWPWV